MDSKTLLFWLPFSRLLLWLPKDRDTGYLGFRFSISWVEKEILTLLLRGKIPGVLSKSPIHPTCLRPCVPHSAVL